MNRTLFLTIITILCTVSQLPQYQAVTLWNIRLIEQGEWWRILSGNFTHTNNIHLVMNMAALWVIAFLFRPTSKSLFLILLSSALFVGSSLLYSNLGIYAGLSGVLHGLFTFYALSEVFEGRKSSWLLVIGVVVKVTYEQLFGAPASTAELINAKVAIEAHLAGVIFGVIAAVVVAVHKRRQSD